MFKKALQGAISASMLLNGMIVYTPVVLNAQESKAKSTQTQTISNLVAKTTDNSLRVEKTIGDNFVKLPSIKAETNFTFSATVQFVNPGDGQRSAALMFGIKDGLTDEVMQLRQMSIKTIIRQLVSGDMDLVTLLGVINHFYPKKTLT